jgi:hypothetical protein
MKDSELKYYYPYSFDKKFNLREKLKNRDAFLDELWGKNEYFYKDEGNYGYTRNRQHLSLLQCSINDYIALEYFDWERWFKNGRNIFSFSKELLEMLNHTDVREITFESFQLPYDNFYISLRPLQLKVSADSDKIIEGVYVSIDRLAMQKNSEEDSEDYEDFAISFHFVGDFEEFIHKYHDKVWNDFGSGGQSFWSYAFFFNKRRNIVKIIDAINDWKDVYSHSLFPEEAEETNDGHLDLFNLYLKFVDSTCIILVNCLLYLSMPQEDKDIETKYTDDLPFNFNKKLSLAKSKNEKAKIESKISASGFSKIQYVGKSYARQQINQNGTTGTVAPHWRRGHWRNQRFGEKLTSKKIVWIKPVIVNQEKGEPVKGHVYEVDEKKNYR